MCTVSKALTLCEIDFRVFVNQYLKSTFAFKQQDNKRLFTESIPLINYCTYNTCSFIITLTTKIPNEYIQR